jgi:hypothetical protein
MYEGMYEEVWVDECRFFPISKQAILSLSRFIRAERSILWAQQQKIMTSHLIWTSFESLN